MKLIFLLGMPGVGKLTVAREVSRLTGFKVFHNHLTVDLVTSVFEFGSPPFIELREKIWLSMFSEAVRDKLPGLIFTFAFDRTVRDNFTEKVRETIEKGGGQVLFVELKCSMPELENRIADPSRQEFGKLNSLEWFRDLREKGAFVRPNFSADLVIDTTEIPAGETARSIVDKLDLT